MSNRLTRPITLYLGAVGNRGRVGLAVVAVRDRAGACNIARPAPSSGATPPSPHPDLQYHFLAALVNDHGRKLDRPRHDLHACGRCSRRAAAICAWAPPTR